MSIQQLAELAENNKYNASNFKYKSYQYIIKVSAILESQPEHIDLTDFIGHVRIFNVFRDLMFPVVKVSLNLNRLLYNELVNNYQTAMFKLNIDMIEKIDEVKSYNDLGNSILKESWLKNIILVPTDFNRNKYKDDSAEDLTGFTTEKEYKMELELMSKEHLDMCKELEDGIFVDVKLKDMLVYLLNKCGMDMFIKEPDNNKKIQQILLPSKNIPQSISYLQEMYGIYSSGVRLYFDFNRGYCLPFTSVDIKNKKEREINKVICYVGDSNITLDNGSKEDKSKNCYFLYVPFSSNFQFNDVTGKELYGENIVIKKTDTSKERTSKVVNKNLEYVEISSKDKTNSNKGIEKTKYYYNPLSNPYTESEDLFKILSNNLLYSFTCSNIDLRIFTMEKQFFISFLDEMYSDYDGNYVLDGVITDFMGNGGDVFNSFTFCKFYRMSKTVFNRTDPEVVKNSSQTKNRSINSKSSKVTSSETSGNSIFDKGDEKEIETASYETYEVKKGDTLQTIANKFNTTVSTLTNLNNLKYNDLLYEKQILRIRKK